jgi:cytochrome c-type biogenesis protein CcmF
MYILGTFLIFAGIGMALLATISYLLVIRGNLAALGYGRVGVIGTLTAVITGWVLLISLFLARRFEFDYVYNYSSLDLEFFFTIAASWAGQPGSFMIWILFTSLSSVLLINRSRHFEPYVLAVNMLVTAVLLGFVAILNPFAPLVDAVSGQAVFPDDGRGLNPLLHNFWMIIHPPILFVGYALALMPFSFAIAGLLRRDYDTWVKRALPWTIAAWSVLGLALLLGGYWAYETLGWGGYWGWDPVENSSLVPWIILTALLHGMLVQRTGGGLRRTNFILGLSTYVTVFYATFLTRSGVYANFSVHSFVAEGIFEGLVGFLVLLLVATTVVLGLRWNDIPTRPLSERFFSRDSFFVLGIIAMIATALVVGIGTSMPVISAIPGVGHTLQGWMGSTFELDDGTLMNPQAQPFEDGRFSLAPSFYQQTVPPLGVVIITLLIIGPLLGWRDSNLRHLLRSLRWPALLAVIAAVIGMLIDVRDVLSLAYVAGGAFALGTNILMIVRSLRSGLLRIGGYLAHVGLTVMAIGMVGSSAYATPETRLTLAPGESARLFGYEFIFNGYDFDDQQRGVLDLTVSDGQNSYSAKPFLYFNERMGATTQTPSIHSYIWQDLYISPAGYDPERDQARPVLGIGESAEMGPFTLTFTGFNVDRAAMAAGNVKVGAKVDVLYEGQILQVEPRIEVQPNAEGVQELVFIPAELPGGRQLNVVELDPNNDMVLLAGSGEGIDGLPVAPAKAVIAVSVKPLVLLVWVGAVLMVIGGGFAVVRRYLEGSLMLAGRPVRLPRALPDFAGRLGWRGAGQS